MVEAGDFVAVHARHEKIIPRVVRWIARFETHAVGDAPTAQVLASSGIGEIGRRKIHAAVGLFDDEAADTAPGQLDGQRQTDRTARRR